MELHLPEPLRHLRSAFVRHGFDLRLVGGCVRDTLAGLVPKDLDLCTDATPDEQRSIYQIASIRHIDTGLHHGTWTVVLDNVPYEITSLRTETDHDGRHATVHYTKDWAADLSRRDLTINAMSLTFDGELFDPFNGADDLANRRVRFVGNARERITEDYLRILRYFRFQARFGSPEESDDETREALITCAHGLAKISRERVWSEMARILSGPEPAAILASMRNLGIVDEIDLPICPTLMDVTLAAEHSCDPIVLLAAYLRDSTLAWAIAEAWKMSLAEKSRLVFLTHHLPTKLTWTIAKRGLAIDGVPRQNLLDLVVLQNQNAHLRNLIVEWEIPVFPVTGADLLDAGIPSGPTMGAMLRKMRAHWEAKDYQPDRAELLEQGLR